MMEDWRSSEIPITGDRRKPKKNEGRFKTMLASEVQIIEVSLLDYPEIVDLLVPQNITNDDIRDLDSILEILGGDQSE